MSKNIHEGVKKLKNDLEKSIESTNIALKQVAYYRDQIKQQQIELERYKDLVDTANEAMKDQNKYIEHLLRVINERNDIIRNISERKLN